MEVCVVKNSLQDSDFWKEQWASQENMVYGGGTGVALPDSLVVLSGGQRHAGLAVHQGEEGRLLPLQEVLHHDLRPCDPSRPLASPVSSTTGSSADPPLQLVPL